MKKDTDAILIITIFLKRYFGDFLALTVEDPFFGRMTDIKDVIG